MDKNKLIIITGIAVALIIISLFLVNKFFVSQKTDVSVPAQEDKAPSLPVSEIKKQIVSDPENLNEINSAFLQSINQPVTEKTKEYDFQSIELKDKNNQLVLLDDFAEATSLKINPNMKDLLRNDNYFLFSCLLPTNKKSFGIAFRVKLFDSYPNLFPDEVRWMKEWEKTMLKDTRTIVFPDINFNETNLNQEIKFRDGQYRYAEVVLPDGSRSSINYTIIADYVVIVSSQECLGKMHNYLEPMEL